MLTILALLCFVSLVACACTDAEEATLKKCTGLREEKKESFCSAVRHVPTRQSRGRAATKHTHHRQLQDFAIGPSVRPVEVFRCVLSVSLLVPSPTHLVCFSILREAHKRVRKLQVERCDVMFAWRDSCEMHGLELLAGGFHLALDRCGARCTRRFAPVKTKNLHFPTCEPVANILSIDCSKSTCLFVCLFVLLKYVMMTVSSMNTIDKNHVSDND